MRDDEILNQSGFINPHECHECKFCCSFRRQSLWETPVFDKGTAEQLAKKYPGVKFVNVGDNSARYDLSGNYLTSNPEEEAKCPFLDNESGCVLSAEEKPFDCKLWPLRLMSDENGQIVVALVPTCRQINRRSLNELEELIKGETGDRLAAYGEAHKDIVKKRHADFPIIYPLK